VRALSSAEVKDIVGISVLSSLLGVVYIILGFCSVLARASGECGSAVTPGDLGLGILLISIGAVLVSSAITIRSNIVISAAASLVGTGLAVGAMVIQLLSLGASWLDGVITGEPLTREDLVSGLIRADALLGYIALPLLPVVVETVRKKVVEA
jgi:hypothetical protein